MSTRTQAEAAPAVRRYSGAGRIARVALGGLGVALGCFLLFLLGLLLVHAAQDPPESARLSIVGVLVVLFTGGLFLGLVWMSARRVGAGLRGRPPLRRAPPAPSACDFCGADRSEVGFLVAGRSSAICDGCVPAVMAEFAREHDARDDVAGWCSRLLQTLPRRCPRVLSRPLIEGVVGPDRAPRELRNAVAWCLKLSNEPLARELLEVIPEAERAPWDWLVLGVALEEEGRYAEALEATARVTAVELRPCALNNAVWMQARLAPAASAEQRAGWLRQVDEARRLVEAKVGGTHLLHYLRGTEAELRRPDDPRAALAALDQVTEEGDWTGTQLVIRARALQALGHEQEARAALDRSLKRLHPESSSAAEARALLAATPPAPAAGTC